MEIQDRMLVIDLELENLKSSREADKIECERRKQDLTTKLQKSNNKQTNLKEVAQH